MNCRIHVNMNSTGHRCWNLVLHEQYICYSNMDDDKCNILQMLLRVKRYVLYSAVSSPFDRSKRFTLFPPGKPVHSDTNSASL